MDIAEFLAARLDEDERMAKAAAAGPWRTFPNYPGAYVVADADGAYIVNESEHGDVVEGDAEHIARHDPARVLAEVAAKRAILAQHARTTFRRRDRCSWCIDPGSYGDEGYPWPCLTVAALASVYADHPDYDPAWSASASIN